MTEQALEHKPIDKWIPWFFVLFFLIVFAVNAVFVTVALGSFTGTVTDNAYEEGLTYNKTLEKAAKQASLGWNAAIALQDGNILNVHLSDSQKQPLPNAEVIAKLIRPVQDGYDFELTLKSQADGSYSTPINFPLPGQWQVRIFATWQDKHYQHSKMITVP